MSNLDFWRNNWSPLKESMALSRALDKMLEEWPSTRTTADMSRYNFSPSCQVTEDKNAYYLKVDLPGVTKEDIKIDLHDNRLSISGERKEERSTEDKENKTHFSEMFYGSFSRSMTFPMPVDAEKTEAKYEAGVLSLVITKKTTPNSRQINVK